MTENSIPEELPEDNEDTTSPSRGTILILFVCAVLLVGGVFLKYALNLNINHEKECTYRGGVWNAVIKECIYENGTRGVEQVGMNISSLTVSVPGSEDKVVFERVEVGLEDVHVAPIMSGAVQGTLSLVTSLGKVQKETQDLIMPFMVRVGGSAEVAYLGLFRKVGEGYEQIGAEKVGNVIGQENLKLSPLNASSSYSVRLSYRDRKEGESITTIPTEPRVFEMFVREHAIRSVSVIGREGIIRTEIIEE